MRDEKIVYLEFGGGEGFKRPENWLKNCVSLIRGASKRIGA